MFHVKHRLRPRIWLLLALLLLVPLLVACEVADQPDGWAAPTSDPEDAGTLLLATGEDRVVAVDLATSNALWVFPREDKTFTGLDGELEPTAFYADPLWSAFTNEWLVAEYKEAVIFALHPRGHSARVVFDVGELFEDARIVSNLLIDPEHPERIYVVTTDYHVHAFNLERPPTTVDELVWTWSGESEQPVWGSPALIETDEQRLLVIAGLDGRVTALQLDGAEAGTPAWSRQIGAGVASAVVSYEGVLYFGAFDRRFYALDPATGATIWTATGQNWFWSTPTTDEGVVFAADLNGNLYAWDARTGAKRWDSPYAAGERIRSQALIVRDNTGRSIVAVTRDGVVHRIDAATGVSLWRSSDVIDDDVLADALYRGGELFISNESGRLFKVTLGINAAIQVYPRQDG